jgi:phosphatidylserine/phosphatidylglycerophosphate/cardiolipin synthase-like enzyme
MNYLKLNKTILASIFVLISSCSQSENINKEDNTVNAFLNIPSVAQGKDPNFLTFFSDTYEGNSDNAQHNELNPDKQFIKTINEAKESIDICAYVIDSMTIANAIIDAHNKNIKVRIVVNSETNNTDSMVKIKNAGIPIVDDNGRSALMHNKFAVIDSDIVWTGSFNFTDSASWKHNDNAIKIKNRFLARNFIVEFEEMFNNKKFGRNSPENVTNRMVRIGNKYIKVFFAPEDNVPKAIIDEIKKAEKEIKFMSYSFTHEDIAKAMEEKAKKGIKVSGIFENVGSGQNNVNSVFSKLRNSGIELFLYKNANQKQAFMHHKVVIIDGKTVTTGSFNFTYNASQDNDENMLVISSSETAQDYLREFDRIKEKLTVPVNN